MRYYHEPGDTIEFDRQEAFNACAIRRQPLSSYVTTQGFRAISDSVLS